MSAGYPANKRLCLLLTLTSQMPIPPSMPVVQNLVHWLLPPSSTEISLEYSLRQVKLCAHGCEVAVKQTSLNRDDEAAHC